MNVKLTNFGQRATLHARSLAAETGRGIVPALKWRSAIRRMACEIAKAQEKLVLQKLVLTALARAGSKAQRRAAA